MNTDPNADLKTLILSHIGEMYNESDRGRWQPFAMYVARLSGSVDMKKWSGFKKAVTLTKQELLDLAMKLPNEQLLLAYAYAIQRRVTQR